MRRFFLLALALSGCKPAGPAPQAAALYRGEGRDRLCLGPDGDGLRAGLVAYGAGDSNCSLSGAAVLDGQALTITPRGDPACTVTATVAGGVARFAPLPAACAYYCAPGVALDGRSFQKVEGADPAEAKDFAGDRLC